MFCFGYVWYQPILHTSFNVTSLALGQKYECQWSNRERCGYIIRLNTHYSDVIMSTMASQITSLTIVYSTIYLGADKETIKAPHHWPLCGEFAGDRWIPRTKGQQGGKCLHLMTSSWPMKTDCTITTIQSILNEHFYGTYCIVHTRRYSITITSHERHGISNLLHLDSLFNRLFWPTAKDTSKSYITGPFWGWLMMTSSNGNICRVTGHLCGEFTDPGEFPTQRPVTRSFDVFFDLRTNKRLSKQWWGWWFETQSCPLWRHRNAGGLPS